MIPEYERKEAEMFERALSWLERLGGIEAVMKKIIILRKRDVNLPQEELQRRLILGLYQYIVSNPNRDLTGPSLSRFLGLGDTRKFHRLIKAAFSDKISPYLRVLGSVINTLRREAGVDNSYIEEVVERYPRLKVGSKDITGGIRIPPRMDGNIARSAGWLITASYVEGLRKSLTREGFEREYRVRQYYELSFGKRHLPLLELEFIPFFEEYFNYTPTIKFHLHERYGRDFCDITIHICYRAITSFYRDVIGVPDRKEERTILFDGELRRYFIAGLIDVWGWVSHDNTGLDLRVSVPLEFKKIAEELAAEFNRKPITTPYKITIIRPARGQKVFELIEKYPISNPRLLFPILWWRWRGEFRKWPL